MIPRPGQFAACLAENDPPPFIARAQARVADVKKFVQGPHKADGVAKVEP